MSEYERIIEYVNGLDDISVSQLQRKFELTYDEAAEYKTQLLVDGHLKMIDCSKCKTCYPIYQYNDLFYCDKCLLIKLKEIEVGIKP